MPQNANTGREGFVNGYDRADEIGALLGAVRLGPNSNEFQRGDRHIVIKTGERAIVITRAMLGRVDAVVYGEEQNGAWLVYEIGPQLFEELSVASRSSGHDNRYRSVDRAQIVANANLIVPAAGPAGA